MTEPKKRKPRRKPKPPMPENMRARAATAAEKHWGRFTPPKLAIEGEHDSWRYACPYSDQDQSNWEALLYEAFGTRSQGVVRMFLDQLAKLCGKGWNPDDREWRPEHDELNMAIAVVASCEAENEAQACIAAQMVALHFTAMKLGGVIGDMCNPDERTAATLARVSKAYAGLARTLAELQGKGGRRQDIHVHYYRDQRQQTVNLGGGQDFGGQPQAPEEIDLVHSSNERRPALPSPGAHYGARVPVGGREGQARVPNAWWFTRLWSAVRGTQR